MAKSERSAGVVVFTTATLLSHRTKLSAPAPSRSYLLLDYGRYWDYPKGHVEKGEDDLTAALRELHEETGLAESDVRVIPGFARQLHYFFRAKGQLIRKEVIFYLAETAKTDVKISHEHVDHAFLPFEEALNRLSFPNAKEVLRTAEAFLVDASPVA